MESTSGDAVALDLLATAAVEDPEAALGYLREGPPLVWSDVHRAWLATSYEDVMALMRDERLTNDRVGTYLAAKGDTDEAIAAADFYQVAQHWLPFKEGNEHARLRGLVQKAFSPRVVAQMHGEIETLANGLIDEMPSSGVVDLVAAFAYPLPATVIAVLLGAQAEDRDLFRGWSIQLSALMFGAKSEPNRHRQAAEATREFTDYVKGLIAERRQNPTDDLLSHLIQAKDSAGSLSEDEVVANALLFLFAGHETTTNLIANAVVQLLADTQAKATLMAGEVEMKSAIEEIIRIDGPGKTVLRIALEDVEYRGIPVKKGQRLILVQPTANRDPKYFADPNVLDLGRLPNPHTGFGAGHHYCLGAPLARAEAQIAVPLLFRRLEGLELDGLLERQPNLLTHAFKALPVRYTRKLDTPS